MSKAILDTNVLVGILKQAGYAAYYIKKYAIFSPDSQSAISIVTRGELLSLASQWKWGPSRRNELNEFLRRIPEISIRQTSIVERYAEIDAFSLGTLPARPLRTGQSSRTMGKNDLWIAATASVSRAVLLTTDTDFDHLNGEFLEVDRVLPDLKFP